MSALGPGCVKTPTVVTPLKWDFCFTHESRHRSGCAADCDILICGGNAKPTDLNLAVIIHCVESYAGLEKRPDVRKVRTGDIGRLLEMKEAAN
jgi:hypothetical protein